MPDLKKLKRISGVIPKTDLKNILEKMKKYFAEHPEELENI
ncbi:MAG: hypothetical protein PHP10_01050 [Candidatus Omnitrophica bacterium]|nr:hypothetical protein [Candidatus Omnitrophota bacterium]